MNVGSKYGQGNVPGKIVVRKANIVLEVENV